MPKRGAISDKEKEFLKKNHTHLSPDEIAQALDRTEAIVKQWWVTVLGISPDVETISETDVSEALADKDLLASPEWEALKEEFVDSELKFFRHRYRKLMAQLKEGITPAEETQVVILIKYEILMKRNLVETRTSVDEIVILQKRIDDIYDANPDIPSMDSNTKSFLLNLENQVLTAKTARQAKSSEYIKLTEKHTSLMRELKATRDQRLSRIDMAAGTLLDTFKALQKEDVAEREGRHMALVALAVEKESKRLGELHTYVDGVLDQPLLTPENVISYEAEEERQDEQ